MPASLKEAAAMTIANVLSSKGSEVETIASESTLGQVVRRLADRRIGAMPVTGGGRIIGIVSERDVIYSVSAHGAEALDWPVDKVMSAPAITVSEDSSVLAAMALMTRRRIRHLPVVDGEAIRGLVSIGDLVKYRMERIEAEAEALRDYIQSA
jgi:CBS domain-containing protein